MAFTTRWLLTSAVLSVLAFYTAGQGFKASARRPVGVTNTYAQDQQVYSRSKAYKRVYRLNSAAACSNRRSGNLCAAAAANSMDAYAQLQMAASPQVYSSTDAQYTGGIRLVSPPVDQQTCDTCSAFAVASAAETAMASVLGVSVSECSISVQALHFCPPGDRPGRYCKGNAALDSVLDLLITASSKLPTSSCMSYNPGVLSGPKADLCSSSCDTPNQHAAEGRFTYKPITTAWEAQLHIRQYGAVVTRFDVMDDFRAFFDNPANAKAVYKPNSKAEYALGHAVVLVGYNNEEQYWVAKNSWGAEWADHGFFKVTYGTCAIFTAEAEAYGVIWIPNSLPTAQQLPLVPEVKAGCHLYKTRPGDYMSKIALSAGVPLNKFVEDNADVVKDLDTLLEGKQLFVCNPKPGRYIFVKNQQAEASDPQLESLLQIKAALDTANALSQWSRESGANAGYCNWEGVMCANKLVVNISVGNAYDYSGRAVNVQGILPSASAFSGLNELKALAISSRNIHGTLPEDWSLLTQLQELQLTECKLKGKVPAAWGRMTMLKVLKLEVRGVTGQLSDSFSSMRLLEELDINLPSLSSPLPAWVGGLPRLRVLRLSSKAWTSPIPSTWKALTSLEIMELSHFSGIIPSWLANFQRLKFLQLSYCDMEGGVPNVFGTLSNLERLYLSYNNFTGPVPSYIGNLKKLMDLGLGNNRFTGSVPESFSNLKALTGLSLNDNLLTGTIPASWSSLATNLKDISLYNNYGMKGCLPRAWRDRCSRNENCATEYFNTKITGFC